MPETFYGAARPSADEDTFKCGRRVRRDMRPALAAPYQVTPRGPNSRRAYLHILPTYPVLAAVSAAESDAIKRKGAAKGPSSLVVKPTIFLDARPSDATTIPEGLNYSQV